jgi:phosphoglycerate dehydrogenase-like enzyme
LLEESDVLSVHVPLTKEISAMIGEEQISKMKEGAFLVNTARGPIVDEVAVAKALKDGKLGGAAFDVPRYAPGDVPKFLTTFKGAKNLFVTPHTSACSPESTERCVKGFTENILRVIKGEPPLNVVNGVTKPRFISI